MGHQRRRWLATAAVGLALATGVSQPAKLAPAQAAATPYVTLSVRQTGGYAPEQTLLMRTPQAVLYSDGALLATSPAPAASYPGPAAPTILRKSVSSSVKQILAAADAAKVTDPKFDWGFPNVADAPDTEFTVQRSAKTANVKVVVYALGIAGPDLSRAQVTARAAASDFVQKLQAFNSSLITSSSKPVRWVSPRWVIWASPASANQYSVIRQWFGAKQLSAAAGCVTLSSAENRKLVSALPQLNAASRWISAGKTWQVQLRPLFPHESGCSDLG